MTLLELLQGVAWVALLVLAFAAGRSTHRDAVRVAETELRRKHGRLLRDTAAAVRERDEHGRAAAIALEACAVSLEEGA